MIHESATEREYDDLADCYCPQCCRALLATSFRVSTRYTLTLGEIPWILHFGDELQISGTP